MPDIKITCIPAGPIETNAYVLFDMDHQQAIAIDAPPQSYDAIKAEIANTDCELIALLLTHGHWDHIGDASIFQKDGLPVYGHMADKAMYETPDVMRAFAIPGLSIDPVTIDHELEHGTSITVGNIVLEVRHVPGHCPGNVLFYSQAGKLALVGDALFAGAIGRTDLPGGSMAELEKSIRQQIYTLPGETTVLPGHGPATSVAREKATNPFVQ